MLSGSQNRAGIHTAEQGTHRGRPRRPQRCVQHGSVLSPPPGAEAGGRAPEGGSHTYYGHLGDEDPPNGIGHPTGGKPDRVSGPEATAPQGARGPDRPPASSPPPYARSVFSIMNLTFSSVSSVIRTVGWLAYGIATRSQSPAPSHTALLRRHQQFVGGVPGASG